MLACQSCGAMLAFPPNMRTAVCPYCASPSVVERPPTPGRPNPSFVVAFVIARERALRLVQLWLTASRGLFTHSGLRNATVEDVRGVYVPAYLYGAVAHSSYVANIGENYTETETYVTSDGKGGTTTATRTVTRTEWHRLTGQHSTYARDVLVTAARGLGNAELEAIEPFDLRALCRYAPMVVSGWPVEEPSLDPTQCLEMARGEVMAKLRTEIHRFMPGDSSTGLDFQTSFDSESLELVLVPVWVLALRYDPQKPPLRIVINGQTGNVHGRAPLSVPKILIAIGLGIAVIVVLYLLARFT